MKENDIVQLKTDYEFEAIDENDNPIGMRTIPKGTKCTIMTEPYKGWVDVEFENEVWQDDWGVNDVLAVMVDELQEVTA